MEKINYFDTPMQNWQRADAKRRELTEELYMNLVTALDKAKDIPRYMVRKALLEVYNEAELDAFTNYTHE